MISISMINHHFLAPVSLRQLNSNARHENLPGVLSGPHSDHHGPVSAQVYLKKYGLKQN